MTSEAKESDKTVQTILKSIYSEKYPDEAPLWGILFQVNLEDNGVTDIKLSALQARRKCWYGDALYFSDSYAGKIKWKGRSN